MKDGTFTAILQRNIKRAGVGYSFVINYLRQFNELKRKYKIKEVANKLMNNF